MTNTALKTTITRQSVETNQELKKKNKWTTDSLTWLHNISDRDTMNYKNINDENTCTLSWSSCDKNWLLETF